MTNKEINYTEAKSPLMTNQENLDFRRMQLYIYRTIFSLVQQGFSRDNFIAKLKSFAAQIMFRTNHYYSCIVVESVDYIRVSFFATRHPMSIALYEIKYDE